MSYVIAASQLVHHAAHELAGIGTSLADAAATVAGPTTGIAAAAQDEISVAIAALFRDLGREFQTVSAQTQSFHAEFVNSINAGAAAYAGAEAGNARAVLTAAASPGGIEPLSRWTATLDATASNAQTVVGAAPASLNTLAGGISTGLRQLATDPTAFFGNLRTAAQSVFLVGAPQDVASAVVQHTLGGVTQATNGSVTPPEIVPINDVHVQLYEGLVGLADFQTGSSGFEQALVAGLTNFAASPASGVLLGAVGPFVSPAVALWNTAGSVFADLTGGSPVAALGHLINAPANVVDAFFNGATLNLDALAPTFDPFVTSGSAGGNDSTVSASPSAGCSARARW
ncbi:PE domain-containing protein [Mycobacterium sp. 23]|uniref:PE domain-containing protein n=1 Tax=Mycobacterium sp. 23 TaxID=3400424 RepID=UPI003AAC29A8